MISFDKIDYTIVLLFFVFIVSIGFIAGRGKKNSDDYLLSGRKVGLFLFILTNVATWYGGILGVGEFSYRYGLVSWFTQGFPYYIFALIFAFLFAGKIRLASLYTIPDKLEEVYGSKISILSTVLIFILVSPAPYLLIMGQIISLIFDVNYFSALLISALVSSIYLIKGGYNSNIWVDALSFFVMFGGFILIVIVSVNDFGAITFLQSTLPQSHLNLTGGASITFLVVWFLIALWTFTDPGFHQRCYSAKTGKIAKWGIIISVGLWFVFDFLTNTTGLYARAIIPDLKNPVLAFPYLADTILRPGLKGIFFAGLLATVLSTLNSFIFLSATTFSRDFVYRILKLKNLSILNASIRNPDYSLIFFTKVGIAVTLVVSIIIAFYFESVVQLWYTIGSICIPGIIFLVISSYYSVIKIENNIAFLELILGVVFSLTWFFLRPIFSESNFFAIIEPMLVGLIVSLLIHFYGIKNNLIKQS